MTTLPLSFTPAEEKERYRKGITLAACGVGIVSFDALLVRLSATDGWNVSFWRGLLMATTVSLVLWAQCRRDSRALAETRILPLLGAGLLMAFSSISLVLSFTLTSAANAVVILSAAPLFSAFFSGLWLREKTSRRTLVAIAVAIVGVTIVVSGSLGQGNTLGDALALLAAIIIGAHFTWLRRFPELNRQAVVACAGLLMAAFSLPMAHPLTLGPVSYFFLGIMGLVQMPLAMMLMTIGTRYLPAAEISLFLLLETFLAPIWVWMALSETPVPSTFVGGLLIVATLAVNSLLGLRNAKRT